VELCLSRGSCLAVHLFYILVSIGSACRIGVEGRYFFGMLQPFACAAGGIEECSVFLTSVKISADLVRLSAYCLGLPVVLDGCVRLLMLGGH
jgi:hypothetical protein